MKIDRRKFFEVVRNSVVATVGLGTIFRASTVQAEIPVNKKNRLEFAYALREKLSRKHSKVSIAKQISNGDEVRYSDLISSYSKALPHNSLGEADKKAYAKLLHAFSTGKSEDFNVIPLGGKRLLSNPQAALALQLDGADSHHLYMPPAPEFASEEQSAEMAELYWHALCRDIPASQFGKNKLTKEAVTDLKQFKRFNKLDGATLFRGETPGDKVGSYYSQFLWKEIPYGAQSLTQKYNSPKINIDFMVEPNECFHIQQGAIPKDFIQHVTSTRYIRTGRDMGEWVHNDYPYQGFLNAALILLSYGDSALQLDHPYRDSINQTGFVTLGGPDILSMVAHAANCALKAAWYQKWIVHRRIRPEAFGLRVHNHVTKRKEYPIHESLFNSKGFDLIRQKTGVCTLPIAYPEGCPTHPSYPAGHSVIAGACLTVLKAYFNEDYIIPDPVEAYDNGFILKEYRGSDLTVGGELNKLASNIAIGRDFAGLHWRSDSMAGLKLGEEVTLRLLKDHKQTYNEDFTYQLTKLDGVKVSI